MEIESDATSEDSGIIVGRNSLVNSSELSLDVKIAFSKLVYLINSLDATEENYECLRKLEINAKKYMEQRRLEKGDSANNPISQHSISRVLQTGDFPPLVSHAREPTRTFSTLRMNESSRTDDRILDRPRTIHNSSFRPIPFQNERFGNSSRQNGTGYGYGKIRECDVTSIAESDIIEVEEEGDDDENTLVESLGEDMSFILKKWSVKKDENNLYLTGIKLDRKGNILEKDFVSKKVLSRTNKEIVKTVCGNYKIDEPIWDPIKSIPPEVKELFVKDNSHFPKQWRKLLAFWIEIEKKNSKKKRKSDPKPKDNVMPPVKAKRTPEGDKINKSKIKKTPGANDTSIGKNKSGKKDKPNENKKDKDLENKVASQKKKEDKQPHKKKTENNKPSKQQEKNKKERKQAPKREKKSVKHTSKKAENAKKKRLDELLGNDNETPFVNELADLGGEDMFQMPSTSMTPNGLMASITKENITGRWTPPTNVFDNIYGNGMTPASTSSALEDTFGMADKPDGLVKRMAKAKSAPKSLKPEHKVSHKPVLPKIDERKNLFMNEVYEAVMSSNATRTPDLVKKVFRSQEKDEEEYSDEDDEM